LESQLPYCGGTLKFNIPLPKKNIHHLQCKNPPPGEGIDKVIGQALRNPVGKERLSKIARPGQKAAVLFDDWTRPTPAEKIIPFVLEELKKGGIADQDIVLICANGMHAPHYMSREKLIQKLGRGVYDRYRVVSHDAYDYQKMKFIGETQRLKTPLIINKEAAEADLKVAVGRIAPHGDVGYSGGAKMILPGVAAIWSIIHHHSGSYPYRGILENPLREDIDECGRMAGLDFILNVVTNSQGEVLKAFAGDPILAHRKGVEFGDLKVWGARIRKPVDVVIASPGLNQDAYFMYSMRCLGSAVRCVKEGGTIIVVGSCNLGWSEPTYLELGWHPTEDLLGHDYPGLLRLVLSRAWCEPNRQFQALVYYVQHIARTCQYHRVMLVGSTGFKNEDARKLNIECYESMDEAIDHALQKHGPKAEVAIIPDSFTLPLKRFHRVRP
jgi:lactate racemase